MKRQVAERSGRDAENRAAHWLEERGWSILARRLKTKAGEIDLVARRETLVAFVEVKWRLRAADLDCAIDERRLARVAAAAEAVAQEYLVSGDDMQIDVILLAPGIPPRHIANAWQP
ncbi:YraN family protein [Erythrobacter litoralis]|uniref:YraN family protein n=1 Tax=Erythrobacter litoralis TaxID=39960 RepID=UPI002434AA6A|nr:YraN family protein [Erythrobacter litoralis]MDG6079528.1 YraN family protein [Erythrobacter litoralis]